MSINKTKNYKQFKFLDYNRDINKNQVQTLVASIKQQNDLHLFPIVINEDFEIVDGQHRLEAAKIIGCDVYYIIDYDYDPQKITTHNTIHKNWTIEDHLKKYTVMGNENYKKLTDLVKDTKLNISTILRWVSPSMKRKDFNNGNFKFKLTQETLDGIIKMKQLINTMKEYNFKPVNVFVNNRFQDALRKILMNPLVDFGRLMEKINKNPRALHICYSTYDYTLMFIDIYNSQLTSANALKLEKVKNEFEIKK